MNRQNRSYVWQHFAKVSPEIVRCSKCNKHLRYSSSTSTMWNHLKRNHADTDDELQESSIEFPTSNNEKDVENAEDETCAALDDNIRKVMPLSFDSPVDKAEIYCKIIREHMRRIGYQLSASCCKIDPNDDESSSNAASKKRQYSDDLNEDCITGTGPSKKKLRTKRPRKK